MSESAAPPSHCAQHPAQRAFVSCRVCGRAACAYCLPESADGETCAECFARAEPPGVIAWERADLNIAARLLRTTRDVLTQTTSTFEQLADGSVTASLLYVALLHALLALAASLAIAPCMVLSTLGWQTPLGGPSSSFVLVLFGGSACASPFLAALSGVALALTLGAVFHAASRALGGLATFTLSARAAAYALAVESVWLLFAAGAALPGIGPYVIAAVGLAQLVWLGTALTHVARTQHALSDTRARLAGFAPSLLIALLCLALGAAAHFASDALDPTQGPDVYR